MSRKRKRRFSQRKKNMSHHQDECVNCHPIAADEVEEHTQSGCPERILQPQLPSPNSPLPMEELERLQRCIHEVNEFLQVIGNPVNLGNTRALQLRLRKLKEQQVVAMLQCGDACLKQEGKLLEVGLNFILLQQESHQLVIPFSSLYALEQHGYLHHEQPHMVLESYLQVPKQSHHEQELCHISDQLRHRLVLCFGETVAYNPRLINIFFGLPLANYLTGLLKSRIKVRTGEEELKGILVEVEEQALVLKSDSTTEHIAFEDICYLVFDHFKYR